MAATSVCSSGQTTTSASSKGVRVVLRERRRTASDEGEPVLVPLASGGVELNNDPSGGSKFGRSVIYNFDSFYSQEATQDDIFDREVKDSLHCLLQGINLTIMAYGATGSGKTFTMQGSDTAPGIIPRALQELLHLRDVAISSREAGSLSLHVSYLEIYNDRIYDLLSPCRQELAVRQSTDAGVFVAGLTEVPVLCIEDFSRAYSRGVDNRTTGPTALNHFSSRSHALLMLTVKNKVSAERLLTGKLYLIDLAGSEDNRRTGNTGVRLTESGGINSSLFVLGKCVSAINAGSKRVPFRDSKLTRLLQDSLGGSTQSLMIVAISPGSNHFAATYQTLQFASKSRQIVNVPVANVTVTKKQEEEKRVLEIAAQARLKRQQRLMKTTLTKPGKAGMATGEGRRAARTPLVGLATTIARASDIDREKENQQSKGKLASKTMPTSSTTTEGTPIPVRTPLSISKLIPIATPNTEHSSNSNSTRPARLKEVRRSQRQRTLKIATDQLFTQDDSLDSGIDDADHDQDAYPCYQPSSSSDDDGADSRSFFDDDDDDDGDELPKRGKKPAAKRQRVRAAIPASSETHRPSLSLVSEEIERELLIYLNSHPLKDLQSLHCIGKKRADLILACRPFSTLENLSMIGLKKASLADFVQRNAASLQLHQQKQKD